MQTIIQRSGDSVDLNPFQPPASDNNALAIAASPAGDAPPIAFYLGIAVVLFGTLMVSIHASGIIGGLFFMPFIFGPLMLAWIPMWLCRSKQSQGVLVFADVAFALWFLFMYLKVFHTHPDANSAVGLLFIRYYSFPGLLVSCIIAILLHRRDSPSRA